MVKDSEQFELHVADYAVYAITIATSLGIGIYYGCRGKGHTSTSEYLLGQRKLKIFPVMVSLVITFESSLSILGYPAELYIYGIELVIWDAVVLVVVFAVPGLLIGVPLFHPLKVTSTYEYLVLRYKHSAPRYLGSICGMLYYIVYTGVNIYGPSIALAAVTDIPLWASMVVISCAAIVYTSIGGIKTVVWTDVLQFSICVCATIALAVMVITEVGGLKKTWAINEKYLRTRATKFDLDPRIRHTFWSIGATGLLRYHHMIYNQATVQRICSLRTRKEAYIVMLMTGPLFTMMTVPLFLKSIGIFAYFNQLRCDPLKSGQISSPNEVTPYTAMLLFRKMPGMTGLFIASLTGASLSTISSGLGGNSAQFLEDFVKPVKKHYSDKTFLVITKISVIGFGILALALAFLASNMGGALLQVAISLMHCAGGPISGLFLYSIFCPWATTKGAMAGTLTSMIFVQWIALGKSFTPDIPKEPWLPMNPVDNCIKQNSSVSINITKLAISSYELSFQNETAQYWKNMEQFKNQKVSGIKKLYTVSYALYPIIAMFVTILVGSVISFIAGYPPPAEVDTRYMLPIGEVLFPYLPRKWTKCLDLGLDFQKRRDWLENLDKAEKERNEGNQPEEERLQKDEVNDTDIKIL